LGDLQNRDSIQPFKRAKPASVFKNKPIGATMTFMQKKENPGSRQPQKAPASPKNQPEESALEKILKPIRRNHEFPSISKYLIEINSKLSANPDTSNASELANVILKDYALTNKLLKLVNSAFYGFIAGKVTTVTRAVIVLGFENIRMATLSLVLFEHFKTKSNVADLKEVVISSFWAGVIARDIAKMGDDVDPEEAFVCAMMNQLGKLLMIYYEPDKYRKICDRMLTHGENETKAAKFSCGVTYDELGMAVAKQWSFPPKISDSMPILSRTELEDKKKPPDKLWALSSFVKELGNIIRSQELHDPDQAAKDLIERYQKSVKISKGQLKTLVKESLEKAKKHAIAMNFGVKKSNFLNRLTAFNHPDRRQPESALTENLSDQMQSESFQLTDQDDIKEHLNPTTIKTPEDIIMAGVQEISEAMTADLDVNDVALMSLEVIYRALKFHRALMFIRESDGKMMAVRYGYGDNVTQLTNKIRFKTTADKDLFGLSIKVGKDLIVADAYDPKLNQLIPSWYRKNIDAPAFIFLPVMFKNICIGAFYADRDKDGAPITETEHRHLSILRNQLILAIKFR
jgi:HD-like signal output (HDOD) protein